ncbi:MAG: aminotransferase class I/II-fold pyridoxal phosphate-dependent enzyme [Oscillospiraceae bacterium]|jgi:aspartate/methionine/tyrosine aminotransferase|nr:aminotransferase class I/II-fold pyridoxal phosphate-dependent enzyme [Oscillospiraceae bacterium]
MQEYGSFSAQERAALLEQLREEYAVFQGLGLKLDMSRGKPGADQLDLSAALLDAALLDPPKTETGFDCRNYGLLDGIPEAKRLFAALLDLPAEQILVCGNSSLNLMYDYLAQCMLFGADGEPWAAQKKIKFLCPTPGYDRHFSILEHLGIEMIAVPMRENGPDMAFVEQLVRDESVKGLICVPKYSNPEGKTYSDETVCRLAALHPAAKDFRVIWDNAYLVHDLYDATDPLLNIFTAARDCGTEDHFIEVTSFSKISFPSAGISAIAASPANLAAIQARMAIQTIGHDKLNQLRHFRFFRDARGIYDHMQKHAAILRPKFETVLAALEQDLGGAGIASWTNPRGGYFISLDILGGCAKRTGQLCKEAGVVLTPPGATYPYGRDPEDKNLRIAPTFPPVAELEQACALLTLCVRIAALEKLGEQESPAGKREQR